MARNYVRKTEKGPAPDIIRRAVDHFLTSNDGTKKTAELFGVARSTPRDYLKKRNTISDPERRTTANMPVCFACIHQVFSDSQEEELKKYIQHAAEIYFGLCPIEVRILAFRCAQQFDIEMPPSWAEKERAGADWFTGFLKRHPGLSIRTPEATSIGRASAFNKANVDLFFSKLGSVLDRHKFEAKDIWNIDETGITTAQKPRKVVASSGIKQIGSLVSAERGQLVTVCAAVSAGGQTIPPFFVFPRVKFSQHFLRGSPVGSDGSSHKSGWIVDETFCKFLNHFKHHVKPSREQSVLMILDNHSSHLSIEALEFAKQNGIVMVSFPPHCSHRLQPLDLSVFGPLKKRVATAQQNWLRSNPGQIMTIYDVPGLVGAAWSDTMVARNITAGFQKAGIFPFNPEVFTEDDYAPSSVTGRPDQALASANPVTLALSAHSRPDTDHVQHVPAVNPGTEHSDRASVSAPECFVHNSNPDREQAVPTSGLDTECSSSASHFDPECAPPASNPNQQHLDPNPCPDSERPNSDSYERPGSASNIPMATSISGQPSPALEPKGIIMYNY